MLSRSVGVIKVNANFPSHDFLYFKWPGLFSFHLTDIGFVTKLACLTSNLIATRNYLKLIDLISFNKNSSEDFSHKESISFPCPHHSSQLSHQGRWRTKSDAAFSHLINTINGINKGVANQSTV